MDKTTLKPMVTHAVVRVGEAGSEFGRDVSRRVADGISAVDWSEMVPEARRMLDVGAKMALARQGIRVVSNTTRRNPLAAAGIAAVVAGLGVAVWLTRRHRQKALEADAQRPSRSAASRTSEASASKKRPARKSTAKRATASKASATAGKSASKSARTSGNGAASASS